MKLYLDDERPEPEGWFKVETAKLAITYLEGGYVSHLSLDHDLGEDWRGTGYDVLLWVEKQVHMNANYFPPKITVHSANPSAKEKMLRGVESIEKAIRQKVDELLSD